MEEGKEKPVSAGFLKQARAQLPGRARRIAYSGRMRTAPLSALAAKAA